ncbi:hypothetical protein BOTBODRAFT_178583 [Botryobasidium botryosum FD-172 SS1]|uniref:F-box domain-containing protein n=1 Tax=Botryobasidium botryosum (strain FD-172 SS1) TaxID=930990 RepID=A0A067MEM6_BOTB1|nr:hypothetical protein BOTBODRAFT_178583 [Botryobasidium botryosum FD-172 SS1]
MDPSSKMFATDDESASINILPRGAAFATWKSRLGELKGSIQAYLTAIEVLRKSMLALGSPAAPGHGSSFVDALYHEIDASLSEVQSMEAQLCIGRTVLQSMRNQSRALAPINLLPIEVLSRIFSMSIEEDKDSVKCRSRRQTNFADTPAQVCRYWRDAAFHTSDLWTRIMLHESMPHHRARAELSLKHSKHLPLHIFVECTSEGNASWLDEVIHILLPHILRCISLEIVVNGSAQLEHLLWGLLWPRPLQIKSVTWKNKKTTNYLESCVDDNFHDVMRGVEHLSLVGICFHWGDPIFAGLLSLTVSDFVTTNHSAWGDPRGFEDVLRGCPMLEYLELSSVGVAMATWVWTIGKE